MSIAVVIPAYNEERTIRSVIRSVKSQADRIFVVDDGSQDSTARLAQEAGAEVVSHSVNRGIGAALMTGYDMALRAEPEVIVQMDGDGQHDPSYIPKMIEGIRAGYDVLVASRYLDSSHAEPTFWRHLGISFFSKLTSALAGVKVTDVTSGYRAFAPASLKYMGDLPARHWAIFQTYLSIQAGCVYGEIPARMNPRTHGDSQFSILTATLYPFNVARSVLPYVLGPRQSAAKSQRQRR